MPSVSSLWRYPVKSMRGEALDSADVTAAGLLGDRAYALVDRKTNRVGSAKSARRFGGLLQWQAQFVSPPEIGRVLPGIQLIAPDGTSSRGAADFESLFAAHFGQGISLERRPPDGLMLEFAAGTLGGKHVETTAVPVGGGAPAGTFFDYGALHLITTSTIRRLKEARRDGDISVQRFRANVVVESDDDGFVENAWVGRTIAIGADVTLHVTIPCPRCVMPTLAHYDLQSDPTLLRLIAQTNTIDLGEIGRLPCAGVYASVVRPGRIRSGDAIRLID
jgi:uncharacterized protein YcbX